MNLTSVLREVHREMGPLSGSHGVRIQFQLGDPVCQRHFRGDPGLPLWLLCPDGNFRSPMANQPRELLRVSVHG